MVWIIILPTFGGPRAAHPVHNPIRTKQYRQVPEAPRNPTAQTEDEKVVRFEV